MENWMTPENRGVVQVNGPDAAPFLQGLLTNDVLAIAPGHARYAALLTPQGKILFDFLVVSGVGGFYLDAPAELAADLAKRLGFYRLRAKVEVLDMSGHMCVAAFASDPGLALGYQDPRAPGLGWRAIVPLADVTGNDAAYDARRIALGVPKGGVDFAYGDTFVHEANLDLLHGVDFKKGCYVGQEVVSRVEHRGLARKRIMRVTYQGVAPIAGTAVMAGEVVLGIMGSSAGGFGLAMLRLDRLADVAGVPMLAGNTVLEMR